MQKYNTNTMKTIKTVWAFKIVTLLFVYNNFDNSDIH